MNLLGIKHWQLFLVIIGILFLNLFIPSEAIYEIFGRNSVFISFIIIFILEKFLYLTWLNKVGHFLIVKVDQKFLYKYFNLIFIFPIIDILVKLIFISTPETFFYFQLFLISHITTFVAQLIIITIIAKNLKSVENKKSISVRKCIEEIILIILFFPFGIWKIQPRINEIYINNETSPNN